MSHVFSPLPISVPLKRQTRHICLPAAQLHHGQPDGVLFYGFYLQSLYRLYYFLKILHYSAGPEMHVSSSYAKLITCLFRCQVQKVFRKKNKETWLETKGELALHGKLKWIATYFFPLFFQPRCCFFSMLLNTYLDIHRLKNYWECWWGFWEVILFKVQAIHQKVTKSLLGAKYCTMCWK